MIGLVVWFVQCIGVFFVEEEGLYDEVLDGVVVGFDLVVDLLVVGVEVLGVGYYCYQFGVFLSGYDCFGVGQVVCYWDFYQGVFVCFECGNGLVGMYVGWCC